jgi:GNAT superfamily N-acetyltransferase
LSSTALFRKATASEADAVSTVYLSSRKRFLPFVPISHSDDQVRRWIANHLIPNADVSVAVVKGKIVGLMALTRSETAGWIDQLYMSPSATGLGIGTLFIKQAKEQLDPPIRLYTFQANEGARRFYERHSFQAIAFGDGSQNEENCPDILFEWRP